MGSVTPFRQARPTAAKTLHRFRESGTPRGPFHTLSPACPQASSGGILLWADGEARFYVTFPSFRPGGNPSRPAAENSFPGRAAGPILRPVPRLCCPRFSAIDTRFSISMKFVDYLLTHRVSPHSLGLFGTARDVLLPEPSKRLRKSSHPRRKWRFGTGAFCLPGREPGHGGAKAGRRSYVTSVSDGQNGQTGSSLPGIIAGGS